MDTLKLKRPVKIDGEDVNELTYDADEITGDMFLEAENMSQQGGNSFSIMETNTALHTYLGYQAIIAVNPTVTVQDLKRIKGKDNIRISKIGRDFTTEVSEESSEENASENSIEVIPESTIQETESCEDED